MAVTDTPAFELRHRLALALEHAGIKPSEMADRLGRSDGTIRNYLKGRTPLTKGTLVAWATICDVPFEWLEQGTGSTGWLVAA